MRRYTGHQPEKTHPAFDHPENRRTGLDFEGRQLPLFSYPCKKEQGVPPNERVGSVWRSKRRIMAEPRALKVGEGIRV